MDIQEQHAAIVLQLNQLARSMAHISASIQRRADVISGLRHRQTIIETRLQGSVETNVRGSTVVHHHERLARINEHLRAREQRQAQAVETQLHIDNEMEALSQELVLNRQRSSDRSVPNTQQGNNEPSETVPTAECIVCRDEFPSSVLFKAPCKDYWCKACILRIVEDAVRAEISFPAKCCGRELDLHRFLAGEKIYDDYLARNVGLGWGASDKRVFCHVPTCARFLQPQDVKNAVGTCTKCAARTCVSCKAAAHNGRCRTPDTEVTSFLEYATGEGWQKCTKCDRMVSKTTGCNHIICACRAEFCYLCGANYNPRTCQCAQFDPPERVAEPDRLNAVNIPAEAVDGRVARAVARPAPGITIPVARELLDRSLEDSW